MMLSIQDLSENSLQNLFEELDTSNMNTETASMLNLNMEEFLAYYNANRDKTKDLKIFVDKITPEGEILMTFSKPILLPPGAPEFIPDNKIS